MSPNDNSNAQEDFTRREFLRNASFSTVMLLAGGVPLEAGAQTATNQEVDTGFSTVGAPVSCAVIGCGAWGREILQTLSLLSNAPVPVICDPFEAWSRRAKEYAPKADTVTDYRQVLERKDVEAVIVATPSHKHEEIVLAALKAGKHVYCEAPLATTVESARAIAQAAKSAYKLNFQAGLQARSDPQNHFVLKFIRSGALGKPVMARSQWHKQELWRRSASTSGREADLNWRLKQETSSGLAGEIGIHQMDLVNWCLNERPVSVLGFGETMRDDNGDRDVADTIQTICEYPGKLRYIFDATQASSFDASYNLLYGKFTTIMMRGGKAWMFKEAEAPGFGWEVYADKLKFYQETGIALAAGASKSVKPDANAVPLPEAATSSLHCALQAFIQNCHVTSTGVKDFVSSYGADADGLGEYLASLSKARLPAAGYIEGLEATVTALKANEAIVTGHKIALEKQWFEV